MEVILREDYISLGYVGDTVRVRRGFARNYLIPRGIAVESSSVNDRQLKHKLSAIIAKRVKKKAEAEAFGKVLEQVTVEFTLKVGAKGKSFGSVTSRDIEASLKSLGYEVDRRQIRLADTIKGPGVYKADVKLHSEVTVSIQVKVMAAQVAPAATGEAQEKGKKKSRKKSAASEAEGEAVEASEVETEGSTAEEAPEATEE